MRGFVAAAAAVLMLSGAAWADGAATPYQPSSLSKTHAGWSEVQLDASRLRVTFAGEAGTDLETVEQNLLYRAAETTLQRGYVWFEVVNHNTDSVKQAEERRGPPLPPIAPRRQAKETVRHQATSEIIMHYGARPADKANAYDARTLQTNLQWRVVRPR